MPDPSALPLARIDPARREAQPNPAPDRPAPTPREKAAIIVRLLLAEGAEIPLSALPDHMQAALTEQMGQMRLVDRATLAAVVDEFLAEVEQVGLAFPGGIDAALSLMDGRISPGAATRLRRLAAASSRADPWDSLSQCPAEQLFPALEGESIEVGAVILSRLPVAKAAELLGKLPGERARRMARAMSLTADVDPDTLRQIGLTLTAQIDARPPRAFAAAPADRIGAILNASPSALRDDLLQGLEDEDAALAAEVRRRLFTFVHIPARLAPRDVPRLLRGLDQSALVTALVGAEAAGLGMVADFLLSNISPRLAQGLREAMAERGQVRPKEAEAAMADIVTTIRQLEAAGELALVVPEDQGGDA
jgi:flagellar motor switch protein FliG